MTAVANGSATITAPIQRHNPARPFGPTFVTTSAPAQPASAGHWKFTAAIGYATVAKAASTTGKNIAPTASSSVENHLRSTDRETVARTNATPTIASTYQPSL